MPLFHVRMDVDLPHDLPESLRKHLLAREGVYAQQLQRSGVWVHLWRIVGKPSSISIFDVASNDELEEVLSGLPLYPYMRVEVTPLAHHPADVTRASHADHDAGVTVAPG